MTDQQYQPLAEAPPGYPSAPQQQYSQAGQPIQLQAGPGQQYQQPMGAQAGQLQAGPQQYQQPMGAGLGQQYQQQPMGAQAYYAQPVQPVMIPVGPAQQTMGTQFAPIKVLYRAAGSQRWKLWVQVCSFCTGQWCGICMAESLRERKYIQVTDRNVEWNDPLYCCCCCTIDRVSVLYYDRVLHDSSASKACCCCTCCDICGEAVVLSGCCGTGYAQIGGIGTCCCCISSVLIGGFDNADYIANIINGAKAQARMNKQAGPPTVTMSQF